MRLGKRITALAAVAMMALLSACAEPVKFSPQSRAALSIADVNFKAPGVFGYGDGLIGKRLTADQVEPVFEAALKKRLTGKVANYPVTLGVHFTEFKISTGTNMVLGLDVAASVGALVTIDSPEGDRIMTVLVFEDASALFGDLPDGAFNTPDSKKIEILAEKFAEATANEIFANQ